MPQLRLPRSGPTVVAAPLAASPSGRSGVRPASWLESAWVLAVGLLVVWRAWPAVPAFTTDSDSYMDVADNLRHGLGLVQRVVDFTRPALPDPLGMWPPLYPVVVAAAAALGLPVDLAARVVAIAGYLLFMVALHRLASATVNPRYLIPVMLVVALRPTLIAFSSTAWSEPLFLGLLVCGILAAIDLTPAGTRADAGRSSQLGSAARGLVLGLACLTRYVGLPVVAGLVVLVALGFVRAWPGLRKAAWMLGSLAPPLAWLARNMVVFGAPFGPSVPPSGRSWHEVIGQAVSALRWEFVPAAFSQRAAIALAFLGLVAVCGTVAFARGGVSRVLVYLASSYLGFTLLAVHASAIHDLAGRYMAPVYAFGIVIVADICLAGTARLRSRALRGVMLAALLLVCVVWMVPRDLAWFPGGAARVARLERAARLGEIVQLQGATVGPMLSDAGHLVRTATGRSAVEIPTPFYAGRVFAREDRVRWEARGVRAAILTRGSFAAPAFADWMPMDSSASFVRFEPAGAAPER